MTVRSRRREREGMDKKRDKRKSKRAQEKSGLVMKEQREEVKSEELFFEISGIV